MKIAISSQGPNLTDRVDPRFGRAAYFIVYDLDNDAFTALPNSQNAGAGQGAGIQTAQLIARQGVGLVVSGNMGPKAFEALRATNIRMVAWDAGTVEDAVAFIRNSQYRPLDNANVDGHWQ